MFAPVHELLLREGYARTYNEKNLKKIIKEKKKALHHYYKFYPYKRKSSIYLENILNELLSKKEDILELQRYTLLIKDERYDPGTPHDIWEKYLYYPPYMFKPDYPNSLCVFYSEEDNLIYRNLKEAKKLFRISSFDFPKYKEKIESLINFL
jgi:hypothetical protein